MVAAIFVFVMVFLAVIAKPVPFFLQAARESLWFAMTYRMSRRLGTRMLLYAGLWILAGLVIALIVGGITWQFSSRPTHTSAMHASSSYATGPSAPSRR
jgi:hypothetical protein